MGSREDEAISSTGATAMSTDSRIGIDSEGAEPMDWIRVDSPGCRSTAGWIVTTGWYGIRVPASSGTSAGSVPTADECPGSSAGTEPMASSARELCAEFRAAKLLASELRSTGDVGESTGCATSCRCRIG